MSAFSVTAARCLLVGLLGLVVSQRPTAVTAAANVPNDERAVVHALNRLAFGPRPGDGDRVRKLGLATWIDQQLRPDQINDTAMDSRLARLTTLSRESEELAQDFIAARQERRRRQRATGREGAAEGTTTPGQATQRPGDTMEPKGEPMVEPMGTSGQRPALMSEAAQRERRAFAEMAEAKILRAVYSDRQLEEVLVDFWFNHFNVFARKGQTEIYVGEYEREAIRPHVLGSFRELLGATAKSPAMLVYLDNWMSADPNAASRLANSRRPNAGANRRGQARLGGQRPGAQQSPDPNAPNRMPRGLNENYARELLELHTLGVDGGYTQQDVVEVARAFTGWTIGRPADPGFRFVEAMHDRGAKKVLGHNLAAGSGIEDGEKVLDIIASHQATARHISFKLAQRFVSDAPPDDLVDRAAETFTRTRGNLREVVRTIVTSPEFFAPAAYRAKVKTPFEFVVSALRATDADVRQATATVRTLAGLGMPLYLCQPPTGYDETADSWVSSGALVNRMNFALAIAGGQMRGISVSDLSNDGVDSVRQRIVRSALAGDVSTSTLETIAKAATAEQAVALVIGSPEFQRQ